MLSFLLLISSLFDWPKLPKDKIIPTHWEKLLLTLWNLLWMSSPLQSTFYIKISLIRWFCLLSVLADKIYNLYQFSRPSVCETKARVWVSSLFVCLVLWSLSKKIEKKEKKLKLFCHVQIPNPRFAVFIILLNTKMPSSVKKK